MNQSMWGVWRNIPIWRQINRVNGRGQYPLQPIKFVNLLVPSPWEAEPYNNIEYKEFIYFIYLFIYFLFIYLFLFFH